MDQRVAVALQTELRRGCADISFLVPVKFKDSVDTGDQGVVSDVKFSFLIKHRVLEIFLQDKSTKLAIPVFLPPIEPNFDVIQGVTYCNSIASVGVFTWFAYPHVSEVALGSLCFFDGLHL